MDWMFWAGLAIGAILSLIGSIAANLMNNRVSRLLEGYKLASKSKRRSRTLREFRRAHDFHTGKFDRIPYYLKQQTSMLLSSVSATCCFVGFVVLSGIKPEFFQIYSRDGFMVYVASALLLILTAGGTYKFFDAASEYENVWYDLDHFEGYEQVVRSDWGDEAVDKALGIRPPSG